MHTAVSLRTMIQCSLCKSVLETSSSRRLLSPCASPMQEKIKDFFRAKIYAADFYFDENCNYYVCRSSCHRKLEKIVKLRDEVQSLSAELKASYNQSLHQSESDYSTTEAYTDHEVI